MSSSIQPGSLSAWILAARLKTLTAAIVPVLVGSACAYGVHSFKAWPAAMALIGAIFIQIGTNFANDLFDFEQGADTEERLGPPRAAQMGLLSTSQIKSGMVLSFALATLAGFYLVYIAGWPLLLVGALSIASGIAYTGGPFPLGYHGLGDLFVLIFFGFVAVCTTAYVQAGFIPTIAWWAALSVGCFATAILVVNNVRDRETDKKVGKNTLAVRLGKTGGKIEYILVLLIGYAVPLALWGRGEASPWVLLPLLSTPLALLQVLTLLRRDDGPSLNRCLAGSAGLLGLFGLLFAIGLSL